MNRRRDVDRTSLRRADLPPLPATLPLRPRLDAAAWAALAVWVLATLTAGTAVGLAFAPVWSVLYVLIGVAGWLVAREPVADPADRRIAWIAFAVQAVLNLAWSPLFFGLHAPGLAFAAICLLWLAVLWMTMRFGRIRPLAGYLMAPYMLWVSFALVLNGTIWLMNE